MLCILNYVLLCVIIFLSKAKEMVNKLMKRTKDYDNVFSTLKYRHKRLFISVINEIFGKNYPIDTNIDILPTDGVLTGDEITSGEKNIEEFDSDCLIKLGGDVYLLKCQSYDDDSMAIRIAEYARRHDPDEYACIFTWRRPRANISKRYLPSLWQQGN